MILCCSSLIEAISSEKVKYIEMVGMFIEECIQMCVCC